MTTPPTSSASIAGAPDGWARSDRAEPATRATIPISASVRFRARCVRMAFTFLRLRRVPRSEPVEPVARSAGRQPKLARAGVLAVAERAQGSDHEGVAAGQPARRPPRARDA